MKKQIKGKKEEEEKKESFTGYINLEVIKAKNITRVKEGHLILLKGLRHQVDITTLNVIPLITELQNTQSNN